MEYPVEYDAGYANAGASHKKRALKGFNSKSLSAHEDIDLHNKTLRQRSRILYMAAPLATSAIRTNRTNVIGRGLRLKARLDRTFLNLESEKATEIERLIEGEFALWAEDKRACDATGVNDFYAMQQLSMMSWMLSGDSFTLFTEGEEDPLRPYTLRLHIIEADRICNPDKGGFLTQSLVDGVPIYLPGAVIEKKGSSVIYDGVEVNKNGAISAYHICSENPYQTYLTPKWQRVPAYDSETGMPNILHVMDAERPEQYRGVPYLAHVIEPILQLRRYTESEIMAAVVESYFTAFVTTEAKEGSMPGGPPWNAIGDEISDDDDDYEMGPGTVNMMRPGESVTFADPKRPTSGFDQFVKTLAMQIGAALELPADLLLKAFTSSYSASRAALLEAWKAFRMRREWFVSDFCAPVYEAWLTEAIARGRIDAPGFFDDPLIRKAWLGAEWVGPSQGQLDPTKEIQAEVAAINEGITTREQATVKLNGGSWDANMSQLEKENELLARAGQNQQSQPQGFDDSTSETSEGVNEDGKEENEILER